MGVLEGALTLIEGSAQVPQPLPLLARLICLGTLFQEAPGFALSL